MSSAQSIVVLQLRRALYYRSTRAAGTFTVGSSLLTLRIGPASLSQAGIRLEQADAFA